MNEKTLRIRAHHITAIVLDLSRAVDWYRRVLGMELVEQGVREPGPVRFAELSMPGFGVGLVELPSTATTVRPPGILAPSWLHIVFSVPDLAEARDLMHSRGAHVRAQSAGGKLTALLVDDSEGNEIEFLPESPPTSV
ncbi:MAG: Glyoxalase/Bleomycin resistance protein/Dioxygenase superfamily [Pseudomonadota bacterium]|jgi:catechol 2,3-dioxygenase-like lactoylglutathione lyase family enzyme